MATRGRKNGTAGAPAKRARKNAAVTEDPEDLFAGVRGPILEAPPVVDDDAAVMVTPFVCALPELGLGPVEKAAPEEVGHPQGDDDSDCAAEDGSEDDSEDGVGEDGAEDGEKSDCAADDASESVADDGDKKPKKTRAGRLDLGFMDDKDRDVFVSLVNKYADLRKKLQRAVKLGRLPGQRAPRKRSVRDGESAKEDDAVRNNKVDHAKFRELSPYWTADDASKLWRPEGFEQVGDLPVFVKALGNERNIDYEAYSAALEDAGLKKAVREFGDCPEVYRCDMKSFPIGGNSVEDLVLAPVQPEVFHVTDPEVVKTHPMNDGLERAMDLADGAIADVLAKDGLESLFRSATIVRVNRGTQGGMSAIHSNRPVMVQLFNFSEEGNEKDNSNIGVVEVGDKKKDSFTPLGTSFLDKNGKERFVLNNAAVYFYPYFNKKTFCIANNARRETLSRAPLHAVIRAPDYKISKLTL